MALVAFISLDYGSVTEARLKLDIAKEFGGSTEHIFKYTCCRMRYMKKDKLSESLVGVYEEMPVHGSLAFIKFLQQHKLAITRDQIIGIVHPAIWSCKETSKVQQDLLVVQQLSNETKIPIVGDVNGLLG